MQKINYTRIEDEEYYEAFGIKKEGSKFIVQDTKKVEAAYQKRGKTGITRLINFGAEPCIFGDLSRRLLLLIWQSSQRTMLKRK